MSGTDLLLKHARKLHVTNTSIPRFQQTLFMCNGHYPTCPPNIIYHPNPAKSGTCQPMPSLLACLRSYIRTYVQAYVIPCLHTSTTILTCNYKWSFDSQQQSTTISHGLMIQSTGSCRELARPLFCFELKQSTRSS